ncbi:hypothetical protein SK128_011657 [Halocaridina rubra]|uniref:Uncharacterized protein n=1 Tax=Halocaridina rubra TaxID=373956 RepID=A0AAN8ZP82_HALRR
MCVHQVHEQYDIACSYRVGRVQLCMRLLNFTYLTEVHNTYPSTGCLRFTMKVLVFLSLVALAWGQEFLCHCGMFISTETAELEVHRLPPFDIADCDSGGYAACALHCIAEWEYIFNNGGLDMENPLTGVTMGQESCNNLVNWHSMPNLDPTNVHNNYMLCGGPWVWDGEVSKDKLCCNDGVFPNNCKN